MPTKPVPWADEAAARLLEAFSHVMDAFRRAVIPSCPCCPCWLHPLPTLTTAPLSRQALPSQAAVAHHHVLGMGSMAVSAQRARRTAGTCRLPIFSEQAERCQLMAEV